MSDRSSCEKTYRLEALLAKCEGVDLSLDDEDKAWLRSSYGKERPETDRQEPGVLT